MLFDKGIRKDCDVEMLKVTCEDGRYFVHESLDILDAYASTVILHPLDYVLHLDTKGHTFMTTLDPYECFHMHELF